ncbi:hypothetical protein ID866_6376 [Astraeus odoratus]|nr:hypothetical protein ID866_6376 [Astraeus odoratus]
MTSVGLPPLPPGWTEHVGPGGQPYYYHATSQQSTYIRPLPAFPIFPPPQVATEPVKKKKEKPLVKTPVPGTEWLRVKTTEGNIFYTHKGRKESVWIVPDEIRDAVIAFELEEARAAEQERSQQQGDNDAEVERIQREQNIEVERVKAELEGLVKRKAEEPVPLHEVTITKKPRIEEEENTEGEDGSNSEEEWQKEAAVQLANEAKEEEERKQEAEALATKEGEDAEVEKVKGKPQFNMPARVDLSLEEAKALFKTLLREKDINPLHPWDTSLPLFVSDPRYVLLPSVSARREAFDEYCRDRARELRQQNVDKEKAAANPKDEFDRLLTEEVKSTRTSWSDFRRTWKKDRRFYGWGRDDREREKRFKEFLRELGERKRAAAEKAELDFFTLLRESGPVQPGTLWKDIKRKLSHDTRYDVVGSSSLREELFDAFVKAEAQSVDVPRKQQATSGAPEHDESEAMRRRRERKERALKEREEKVRAQRARVEAEIGRARVNLSKEEGEREFCTLLVDAIRDPQLNWDDVLPELKTDPRFIHSPLPKAQQLHLFHSHMDQLRSKHLKSLHSLFEVYTPSLATAFSALPVESLAKSLPAMKLGLENRSLEREFEEWQRERTSEARKAFDDMLSENAFVEFWGRLGKLDGEGMDGGVKAEDQGEDEGEGFGGKVDMKALAKSVDLRDIVKVLSNDKRYIIFDHVAEQRERWIRSDVARLRRIVINSLYSNRDVFLRELISNANDALEKLRIVSLTEKDMWDGGSPLNVTVKAERNPNGDGGRIIITGKHVHSHWKSELRWSTRYWHWDECGRTDNQSGTYVTAFHLQMILGFFHQGTLAKSGTSDFVANVEGQETAVNGNLIGAFGVGFYSRYVICRSQVLWLTSYLSISFLVADKVIVASIPPRSSQNPNPVQSVFSSSVDESSFEIYPDPRGNTLGHGTEITLELKSDALDYLAPSRLMELINQHSSFSTTFPIYVWNEVEEEVPIEVDVEDAHSSAPQDEEEAVVEDEKPTQSAVKSEKVLVGKWEHVNSQPPLWMRDPKSVSDKEYQLLYQAAFKDFRKPLGWTHFTGDTGSGVSFRAIIYIPPYIEESFYTKPLEANAKDVKLYVKHVFITSDLEEYDLPKWASWVCVIIDADDLPLNVSRETLQSSAFLKQIRGIIIRRLIQLFAKIADEDEARFAEIHKVYRTIFKLGAAEDEKNRGKIASLIRFHTNQRNSTTLDQYVANKKQGQKQIFYLADMSKSVSHLAGSIFVEKLHARGYEVLLLNEPLDEFLVQALRTWKGLKFQDVAKAGLEFGDDTEEEKEAMSKLQDTFAPLLEWLKAEAAEIVRDVVLSDRLVTSPCAVVADVNGFTANFEKIISATNRGGERDPIARALAKKQKVLEINPRSPLIEGLLHRFVQSADIEENVHDLEQLQEVASILIDSALVRSGFEVADSNTFLSRVDRVLRRSLGVSETAPTDDTVKPAPPVDPELPEEALVDNEQEPFGMPDSFDEDQFKLEVEEIDEHGNVVHDEL